MIKNLTNNYPEFADYLYKNHIPHNNVIISDKPVLVFPGHFLTFDPINKRYIKTYPDQIEKDKSYIFHSSDIVYYKPNTSDFKYVYESDPELEFYSTVLRSFSDYSTGMSPLAPFEITKDAAVSILHQTGRAYNGRARMQSIDKIPNKFDRDIENYIPQILFFPIGDKGVFKGDLAYVKFYKEDSEIFEFIKDSLKDDVTPGFMNLTEFMNKIDEPVVTPYFDKLMERTESLLAKTSLPEIHKNRAFMYEIVGMYDLALDHHLKSHSFNTKTFFERIVI